MRKSTRNATAGNCEKFEKMFAGYLTRTEKAESLYKTIDGHTQDGSGSPVTRATESRNRLARALRVMGLEL